eukprot:gene49481-67194_t
MGLWTVGHSWLGAGCGSGVAADGAALSRFRDASHRGDAKIIESLGDRLIERRVRDFADDALQPGRGQLMRLEAQVGHRDDLAPHRHERAAGAQHHRADMLARDGVPAAHETVGAARQDLAAARPDQRRADAARGAVD